MHYDLFSQHKYIRKPIRIPKKKNTDQKKIYKAINNNNKLKYD